MNTMIDLTPLLQAIIALVASLITIYLIPWLKSRTSSEQQAQISAAVHIAVYAAEKLYGAGRGDEKLAYALEYLKAHGFDLDAETLKGQINAAIKEMEQFDDVIEVEPVDVTAE